MENRIYKRVYVVYVRYNYHNIEIGRFNTWKKALFCFNEYMGIHRKRVFMKIYLV